MTKPALVLFDVNETLSDLRLLRRRFQEVGAPGHLLELWFANTLRDGFALAAAGAYADFRSVALGVLRVLFAEVDTLRRDPVDAAEKIVASLSELEVHPDVAEGMQGLADAGVRMATLSNGDSKVAETLFERAGLAEMIERRLSVDAVERWKPAPEPYLYAARELGVPPDRCVLLAVHPWDVDGAKRAGLRGAWLNRRQQPYPDFFMPPDAIGETLRQLAERLLAA